ncbi:MAG: ABC transporter substrate-binding protein [Deltaproteobacteria bacterium]|nr:ABC transporter substrate-binding protein [Deltaproteobacteria bacterium]
MKRLATAFLAVAVVLSVTSAARAEKFVIKTATIAPEGSVWLKVMRRMAKDLKKATDGNVRLKFFAGGVLGDDKVVLEKLRFGQIQAAGLIGVGLGELVPEVRALELPFQFTSYKQTDCVLDALKDDFAKKFEKKGFVLLGWADQGFVYVFSNKAIKSADDMQGTKPWVMESDPLAKLLFQKLGLNPVPLAIPDVFTSLQTGLIDTIYISPVAAIALQWYTKVKYMIDMPIVDGSGAILISKKFFDGMPPEYRKITRELTAKYLRLLQKATRRLNTKSIKVLARKGIQMIKPQASDIAGFQKKGLEAAKSLVGKLYDKATLDRVLGLIEKCR